MRGGAKKRRVGRHYIPDETIEQPNLYSPLTLAFVGDGVYELYVRTRLMQKGNLQANKLHKLAIHYVKAAAPGGQHTRNDGQAFGRRGCCIQARQERKVGDCARKTPTCAVPDGDRV